MIPSLQALLPLELRAVLTDWWAKRGRHLLFILAVSALAAGASMLMTPWYRARATLLPPPEEGESFGLMAGMIQSAALGKLGMMSTSTPSDVFAEILRSRTIGEELIRSYDLQARYKRPNMDAALRELARHIRVDVNRSSIIQIDVEDPDPRRAADMANAMIVMLDRFNRESFVTKAKRTRVFLEERLVESSERMHAAESTLANYERSNRVIASTSENSAVQGIAGLMSQKMGLQVRRSYIMSYSNADSPELREIDAEMDAIDKELVKLPGLKQAGARLALDAEIQRRVFTLLNAQYEDARMQEARDTPTIAVLDRARAPFIRARPRRTVIVAGAFVTALALTMVSTWLSRRALVS